MRFHFLALSTLLMTTLACSGITITKEDKENSDASGAQSSDVRVSDKSLSLKMPTVPQSERIAEYELIVYAGTVAVKAAQCPNTTIDPREPWNGLPMPGDPMPNSPYVPERDLSAPMEKDHADDIRQEDRTDAMGEDQSVDVAPKQDSDETDKNEGQSDPSMALTNDRDGIAYQISRRYKAGQAEKFELDYGSYTILVSLYDKAGNRLYQGISYVQVQANSVTNATVEMTKVEDCENGGKGGVVVDIVFPDGKDKISACELIPPASGAPCMQGVRAACYFEGFASRSMCSPHEAKRDLFLQLCDAGVYMSKSDLDMVMCEAGHLPPQDPGGIDPSVPPPPPQSDPNDPVEPQPEPDPEPEPGTSDACEMIAVYENCVDPEPRPMSCSINTPEGAFSAGGETKCEAHLNLYRELCAANVSGYDRRGVVCEETR